LKDSWKIKKVLTTWWKKKDETGGAITKWKYFERKGGLTANDREREKYPAVG